jgi:hypothetical protein
MTDYDMEKGKTAITGDLIETVAERIGLRATDRTPRLRFSLKRGTIFPKVKEVVALSVREISRTNTAS